MAAKRVSTVAAFGHTVELSEQWVLAVMANLRGRSPREAYAATRAVFHALRDRISTDEAAQLSAQMPMLLRGLFYEGWNPKSSASKERQLEAFLAHIKRELHGHPNLAPEKAASAVFAVLAEHVSAGEVDDIVASLPRQLRGLWPQAA